MTVGIVLTILICLVTGGVILTGIYLRQIDRANKQNREDIRQFLLQPKDVVFLELMRMKEAHPNRIWPQEFTDWLFEYCQDLYEKAYIPGGTK